MAGPFARILAQFVIVAGGAVARSVVNAYKEAASRGAANPAASSLKQAMRMRPDEAAKIMDVELNACTRDKLAQRFKILYEANSASPYIQRKVSNANTVLNDYVSKLAKKE